MDAGLAAEMCRSRSSAAKPLTGRLAAGDVFSGEEEAARQPR